MGGFSCNNCKKMKYFKEDDRWKAICTIDKTELLQSGLYLKKWIGCPSKELVG